jgi:predicted ATP-grasp superfamily ATP-dependent carboligase
VLAALLAAGFIMLLRHYLRSRSGAVARRTALKELRRLTVEYETHRDAVAFSSRLSQLLRRTMLAYAPRGDVAGLTGEAWLAWLDRDLKEPLFVSDTGRTLLELPYRKPDDAVAALELVDLVSAVRRRIATPVRSAR